MPLLPSRPGATHCVHTQAATPVYGVRHQEKPLPALHHRCVHLKVRVQGGQMAGACIAHLPSPMLTTCTYAHNRPRGAHSMHRQAAS
eukprot:scaffold51279_cov20-Tisochrysis_lutea.AAC.4